MSQISAGGSRKSTLTPPENSAKSSLPRNDPEETKRQSLHTHKSKGLVHKAIAKTRGCDGRVHSKVQSVESYLYRGYGLTLGEALDAQFVRKVKISRATQTNWKWSIMAERWGNAKVIAPRVANDFCYSQCVCPEKSTFERSVASSLSSQSTDTEGKTPSAEKAKVTKEQKSSKPREPGPSASPRLSSGESDHPPGKKPEKKKGATGKPRRSTIRKKCIPAPHITACHENDKCQDTADLEFDPFDPRMFYTEKICEVKPMYIPEEIRESFHDMETIWSQTPSYTKYNEMDTEKGKSEEKVETKETGTTEEKGKN